MEPVILAHQIKLHKVILNGIASALSQIFKENRYSDKVLEKVFKQNKQWGSRDRKFIAESVYDIVRHFRLLSHLAQSQNNYWFITSVYLVIKGYELPQWPEFKDLNKEFVLKEFEKAKTNFLLFNSYSNEMNDVCVKELGEEKWQQEAIAMNKQAPVVIRVNTLKANLQKLKQNLLNDNIDTSEINELNNALVLNKRSNIFTNVNFKEGYFELQDAGSQAVGNFVGAKEKDLVIDACAGAGGKSLQLSALMNNKGKIVSMDVAQWKLDELMKRAKRSGANNIETCLIENGNFPTKYKEKADVLLLDVPCSGIGVIKRNPDTKWKFNVEVFEKTKVLQREIINTYAGMLKPGGRLIYSTCSILPSENREQVNWFLEKNSNFTFSKEKTIFPSEGYDGFYMCELIKSN